MHPNSAFRHADRGLLEALVDEIGFATIFAATPDGPRVAHVPLLKTGEDTVQFHLARGNGLVRHLAGATALAVINGPDGYVSPRWYADPAQVPTWNYVALELEGVIRKLSADELLAQVTALSDRHEVRIAQGQAWTIDKLPAATLSGLIAAIVGFELAITVRRETVKLSQNKSPDERARVASGLDGEGAGALAALMRGLAQ